MSCACNLTLGNAGIPSCQPIMSVARRFIAVPMIADDGTENYIDLTDTLNQAYFEALRDQTDASKRWYPMPFVDNVEDTKEDSIKETLNSGQNIFVKEGVRNVACVMVAQSANMLSKLKNHRCVEFGIFTIDKDGNLIGRYDATNNRLYPVKVDKDTWDPKLEKSTDTTIQKIALMFSWDEEEEDGDLRMIVPSEMDNFKIVNMNGLIDVNCAVSGISTTGFTTVLTQDFGSAKTFPSVRDWVAGDFTLYNNTTSASVVITSVTESTVTPGSYVFVIPAQSSSDNMTLSAQKDGYSFADVSIDIPT